MAEGQAEEKKTSEIVRGIFGGFMRSFETAMKETARDIQQGLKEEN